MLKNPFLLFKDVSIIRFCSYNSSNLMHYKEIIINILKEKKSKHTSLNFSKSNCARLSFSHLKCCWQLRFEAKHISFESSKTLSFLNNGHPHTSSSFIY